MFLFLNFLFCFPSLLFKSDKQHRYLARSNKNKLEVILYMQDGKKGKFQANQDELKICIRFTAGDVFIRQTLSL